MRFQVLAPMDSRIMKDGATKEFVQGYNAQAAVDSKAQIIVAAEITQQANDKQQLVPMVQAVVSNLGKKPEHVTADAGYFSEKAVTDEAVKGVDLLVAVSREKHGSATEPGTQTAKEGKTQEPSATETMREKVSSAAGKAIYKFRKAVVEPVFGQIKEVRGLRRFLLRGLEKVSAEWKIICLNHNVLKMFQAGVRPQAVKI